jgi:hypothetical protein
MLRQKNLLLTKGKCGSTFPYMAINKSRVLKFEGPPPIESLVNSVLKALNNEDEEWDPAPLCGLDTETTRTRYSFRYSMKKTRVERIRNLEILLVGAEGFELDQGPSTKTRTFCDLIDATRRPGSRLRLRLAPHAPR